GRTSAGRNSIGVDAMADGGGANVADRAFRVLDAIARGSAVSAFCPVVGENDDHAAPGKILPLLLKLGQVSGSPAPAVEENDSRRFPCMIVVVRLFVPCLQRRVSDPFERFLFPSVLRELPFAGVRRALIRGERNGGK